MKFGPPQDPALLRFWLSTVSCATVRGLLCEVIRLGMSTGLASLLPVLVFNLRASDSKLAFIWVNVGAVNMYYMSLMLVSGSIAISLQQIALTYLKLIRPVV